MTTARKPAIYAGVISGVVFATLTSAYNLYSGKGFDPGLAVAAAIIFGMGMTASYLREQAK